MVVSRGDIATATIRSVPGAVCSLAFVPPDGEVENGPEFTDQRVDTTRQASWNWRVAADTPVGTGRVEVTCDDRTTSSRIVIR